MMSVLSATSGQRCCNARCARDIRRACSRGACAPSTASEPDCTGKCRCSQRLLERGEGFGQLRRKILRMRRGEANALACPSIALTRPNNSAKPISPGIILPYEFTFCPSSITSLTPWPTMASISANDLGTRPAHFAAAHVRHDTKTANFIATLHDRDEGLGAMHLRGDRLSSM